jgi:hypothetical protein
MVDSWTNFENYRIVNSKDPIPIVPPSIIGIYRHCGIPIYHRLHGHANSTNPGSWHEFDNHDFHGEFEELLNGVVEKCQLDMSKAKEIICEAVIAIDPTCHILGSKTGYGDHISLFMKNRLT